MNGQLSSTLGGDHKRLNQRLAAMHNRTVALKLFCRYGKLTRPQLSRLMNLRRSSAANIVREFMDQRLVRLQDAEGKSGPGRQNLLELNAAWGYAVGVGLGHEQVTLSLVDTRGDVLATQRQGHVENPDDLEGIIRAFVNDQVNGGGVGGRLLAVGVSISGIVDARQGIIRQSYELGLHDYPLAERIEAAVGVPVFVDNDAVLATTAEADSRHADEQSDFIYLYPNFMHQGEMYMIWGMGSCLFLNGKLRRGSHGAAGELFRLPLPGPSISFSDADLELLQTEEGEPSASLVQMTRWIAPQLAFPVSLIDPREVVLGGPLRWRNRAVLSMLQEDLNTHLMAVAGRHVRITSAQAMDEPSVLAARMAREHRICELVVES